MITTGRFESAYRSLEGKLLVTFSVDADPKTINDLAGKDLDIDAHIHRNKRSLNANAYFHMLCGKIAKKTGTTLTEVKNQLIKEHGQFEMNDGKIPHLILDDEIDYLKVEWLHLYPTSKTQTLSNGKLYRVYLIRRGSHTYNTKEMSVLIDATVNEAKQLGIETLTPDQLERMKAAWKGDNHDTV